MGQPVPDKGPDSGPTDSNRPSRYTKLPMILDAIISLFTAIFGLLAEAASAVCVPLVNLLAGAIEGVVGLFVSGFEVGRVKRRERRQRTRSATVGAVIVVALLAVVAVSLAGPKIWNRNVTLVAPDGHSLPFAALVIHTRGGDRHVRTDDAGNVAIPKIGILGLTVKDPRYVETSWEKDEIEPTLVAGRTLLGSGLDAFAAPWLRPDESDR